MEWSDYFAGFARHAALKSKDTTQVGAVLVGPEDRFYVYAHFRADDGGLFYIGKGSGRRAWSKCSRNRHWKAVVAKHGRRVRILYEGLSEIEALRIEALLIKAKKGSLATYTSGGAGTSGYRHTEKAKSSMSEKRRGLKASEEARAAMSEAIRSNPRLIALRSAAFSGDKNPARKEANRAASSERMKLSNPMNNPETRAKMAASAKGRIISDEARIKIGNAHRGRKRGPVKPHVAEILKASREARKRAVVTTCGLWFDSTAEAARVTGVRQGNIVNNCVGRAKSAGGFQWRYADANQ